MNIQSNNQWNNIQQNDQLGEDQGDEEINEKRHKMSLALTFKEGQWFHGMNLAQERNNQLQNNISGFNSANQLLQSSSSSSSLQTDKQIPLFVSIVAEARSRIISLRMLIQQKRDQKEERIRKRKQQKKNKQNVQQNQEQEINENINNDNKNKKTLLDQNMIKKDINKKLTNHQNSIHPPLHTSYKFSSLIQQKKQLQSSKQSILQNSVNIKQNKSQQSIHTLSQTSQNSQSSQSQPYSSQNNTEIQNKYLPIPCYNMHLQRNMPISSSLLYNKLGKKISQGNLLLNPQYYMEKIPAISTTALEYFIQNQHLISQSYQSQQSSSLSPQIQSSQSHQYQQYPIQFFSQLPPIPQHFINLLNVNPLHFDQDNLILFSHYINLKKTDLYATNLQYIIENIYISDNCYPNQQFINQLKRNALHLIDETNKGFKDDQIRLIRRDTNEQEIENQNRMDINKDQNQEETNETNKQHQSLKDKEMQQPLLNNNQIQDKQQTNSENFDSQDKTLSDMSINMQPIKRKRGTEDNNENEKDTHIEQSYDKQIQQDNNQDLQTNNDNNQLNDHKLTGDKSKILRKRRRIQSEDKESQNITKIQLFNKSNKKQSGDIEQSQHSESDSFNRPLFVNTQPYNLYQTSLIPLEPHRILANYSLFGVGNQQNQQLQRHLLLRQNVQQQQQQNQVKLLKNKKIKKKHNKIEKESQFQLDENNNNNNQKIQQSNDNDVQIRTPAQRNNSGSLTTQDALQLITKYQKKKKHTQHKERKNTNSKQKQSHHSTLKKLKIGQSTFNLQIDKDNINIPHQEGEFMPPPIDSQHSADVGSSSIDKQSLTPVILAQHISQHISQSNSQMHSDQSEESTHQEQNKST